MKKVKIVLLAVVTLAVVSCKKENSQKPAVEMAAKVASTEGSEQYPGVEKATPVKEEKVDPATAPIITFESDTYDLGNVKAGEKTERVIEFTNTGKGPLLIKNAKASCGCTVPEYSKDAVEPGEKGSLKVSYKAPNTKGKQMKTVTLTTNTVKGKETFKIQAMVTGGQEKKAPQPKKPAAQKLPTPKLEQPN